MTTGGAPEPSPLRTWATMLGFLAALMVLLGGVAYFTGMIGHSRSIASGAKTPTKH